MKRIVILMVAALGIWSCKSSKTAPEEASELAQLPDSMPIPFAYTPEPLPDDFVTYEAKQLPNIDSVHRLFYDQYKDISMDAWNKVALVKQRMIHFDSVEIVIQDSLYNALLKHDIELNMLCVGKVGYVKRTCLGKETQEQFEGHFNEGQSPFIAGKVLDIYRSAIPENLMHCLNRLSREK